MKVSVVIPCYNCEKWIIRCLDSIPTRDDIEIICINDGSTDNTLEILHQYKNRWANLRVLSQENSGQGKTRDRGIALADGKFVCFIDADDFIYQDVFNEIVDNHLLGDIIKPYWEEDNKSVYWPRVFQGCFVRKSLAMQEQHPYDIRKGEDSKYRAKIEMHNPRMLYIPKIMYHYFTTNSESASHRKD